MAKYLEILTILIQRLMSVQPGDFQKSYHQLLQKLTCLQNRVCHPVIEDTSLLSCYNTNNLIKEVEELILNYWAMATRNSA